MKQIYFQPTYRLLVPLHSIENAGDGVYKGIVQEDVGEYRKGQVCYTHGSYLVHKLNDTDLCAMVLQSELPEEQA